MMCLISTMSVTQAVCIRFGVMIECEVKGWQQTRQTTACQNKWLLLSVAYLDA